MGRHHSSHVAIRLLLAGGLILGVALTATADDPPQEEPEQKAQKQEQPENRQETPPKGSLAAAASKIKLQKPAGSDSEGLVISDHNVGAAGSSAVVSQGSGSVQTGAAPAPASAAGSQPAASGPTPAEKLAGELLAQKAKVDNMEAQLAVYDEDLAAPSADPKYPKWADSPYNRSGGVVDPAVAERDAYAKRLEEERAKLEQLLKEAEGAGVRIDKEPAGQANATK